MARVILAVVHKMTTGLRHITSEPANLQLKPLTSGMEKKKSPQLKQKMRSVVGTASDSVSSLIHPLVSVPKLCLFVDSGYI